MEKIKAMLTLQQQLNDATNGQGWEKGHTQHGKSIDWRRCIYLEAAELIESYPWKHWKNIDAKPDYENIKIEAVDIWHFVMSEALRLYKVEEKGSIEDLAMAISQEEGYRGFVDNASVTHQNHYAEIATVEDFVKSLFCNEPIKVLVSKFFGVAQLSGLDLEKLYLLYIGKNILNTFRQDHGYKEGSYLKLWEGREDNVLMQEILESNRNISPEMLYKKLEEVYPG
jgi:dimeric dUTPase (all-alpha-NTP-PPase superfamily)